MSKLEHCHLALALELNPLGDVRILLDDQIGTR
jgi:hypothetical protein